MDRFEPNSYPEELSRISRTVSRSLDAPQESICVLRLVGSSASDWKTIGEFLRRTEVDLSPAIDRRVPFIPSHAGPSSCGKGSGTVIELRAGPLLLAGSTSDGGEIVLQTPCRSIESIGNSLIALRLMSSLGRHLGRTVTLSLGTSSEHALFTYLPGQGMSKCPDRSKAPRASGCVSG